RPCAAVLGDDACRFDTSAPGYSIVAMVSDVRGATEITLPSQEGIADEWFLRGRVIVLTGASAGQVGLVKRDRETQTGRVIELWEAFAGGLVPGDELRIEAGCDKRVETCRAKFDNLLNFRGFPDIPGEDWLVSYPVRNGVNDGGSLG
ncbi:MAG: phage BR0599 family protein, partial [Pseudomonadota bacterium]